VGSRPVFLTISYFSYFSCAWASMGAGGGMGTKQGAATVEGERSDLLSFCMGPRAMASGRRLWLVVRNALFHSIQLARIIVCDICQGGGKGGESPGMICEREKGSRRAHSVYPLHYCLPGYSSATSGDLEKIRSIPAGVIIEGTLPSVT
jgi:hypothetical protein